MTSLDFLSPGLAADHGGMHPVARSSLERRQRDAGATFEERDGWLVPVSLPGEREHLAAAGVADLSHLRKLEVRPAPERLDRDGAVWCPISERRALALYPAHRERDVRAALADRRLIDQTGALGVLALVGSDAPTVLRRLTHVHRFPSSGAVAGVMARVLERPGGYWIVFPQEYGHYLWEVAVDRAGALGGGPVGVDAIDGVA